jgi:hypothetical protein
VLLHLVWKNTGWLQKCSYARITQIHDWIHDWYGQGFQIHDWSKASIAEEK